MKYSDVRRLTLSDMADEIYQLVVEGSVQAEEYDGYYLVNRKAVRRIEDICEEIARRSRELSHR